MQTDGRNTWGYRRCRHEDAVYIYKVNVNYDKALAEQYKVMSVPTVICFVNGRQKGKVVGLKEQEEVEALFEEYL